MHDDRFKICDLGMIKELTEEENLAFSRVGTLNYWAPEVIKRTGYGYKADIYSLGVCIFKLLFGRNEIDFSKLK